MFSKFNQFIPVYVSVNNEEEAFSQPQPNVELLGKFHIEILITIPFPDIFYEDETQF